MTNDICWIDVVAANDADDVLSDTYNKVRGAGGQLDNLYQGFSLRPHTIGPADDLYLAAMHNDNNTLTKTFSELLGTYVAILTGCNYAETHHGHNYHYLCADREHSENVISSLKAGRLQACGSEKEVAALEYATLLAVKPESVDRENIAALRQAGWDDGEILEIAQVVAMFSYFVRVINGIGIQLGNEKPGLY